MDKQTLQTDLIKWFSERKDMETLKKVDQIKQGHDWWNTISDQEKEAIREGLNQLDNGEGIPHEQVMKEAREKYGIWMELLSGLNVLNPSILLS